MRKNLEKMVEKAKNADISEQMSIVEELGKTGDKHLVEPLVSMLQECLGKYEKRYLTSALVRALGTIGREEAHNALIRALDSDFFFVKSEAARALSRGKPSDEALKKLKELVDSEQPANVKKSALKAIAARKNRNAVESISQVMEEEPDTDIKTEAIEALGETKQSAAIAKLIDFYYREADQRLRIDIIESLSKIATASSIEFLLNALKSKNAEIRSCAAMALGETREKIAEVPLKHLLTDPEYKVRRSAAQALGLIRFLPKTKKEERDAINGINSKHH